MDKRKGKKIALQIILSGLFALLVTYIGFWVYDIVLQTGSFVTNESSDSTFACVGYVFDVNQGMYENGKLTFMLSNKRYSDYTLSDIIVITDTGGYQELNVGRLSPGKSKVITIEIPLNTTAKIYPPQCEMYGKLLELE